MRLSPCGVIFIKTSFSMSKNNQAEIYDNLFRTVKSRRTSFGRGEALLHANLSQISLAWLGAGHGGGEAPLEGCALLVPDGMHKHSVGRRALIIHRKLQNAPINPR